MSPSPIRPAGPFQPFGSEEVEQSIVARFEAQVVLRGANPAVVTRGCVVTYAELNRLANRVAHALLAAARDEGEEVVALLFGQGVPLVAAILGTLKAGKMYLPIDRSLPREHVADLLRESHASMVIAENPHDTIVEGPAGAAAAKISWDEIPSDMPDTNPAVALEPDRLAYIYYTSGSTGRPKGVVDSHRNVLHNVMRYTNGLLIGPHDRLTLLQSPSFSGAVSSLFCGLLNGAEVHPISPGRESPQTLADWVREHRLTMWHSVPSLFRHLCAAGGTFTSVRVVRLEGDQALPLDAALYRAHFPDDCVLVNGLGATETGLTRRFIVRKGTPITGNALPVGFVVDDMEVTVLDDGGRPVTTGEVGEVTVRSRFLAIGYWKEPELTSERFQAYPDDTAQRLYRTGDLGRMSADGCLELVGRKDFQVKVLGNAVDLTAVECALRCVPGVAEAVVVPRADGRGEGRLVAYLIPSAQQAPRVSALRKALAEQLPTYMIPSGYVTLADIPLDENGKIDRRMLPTLPATRPNLDTAFATPATATEQWVAQTWHELLGIEGVGLDDSFFELGGQSLELTRILGRVGLPVASLGTVLTVREMAHEIDRLGGHSGGP